MKAVYDGIDKKLKLFDDAGTQVFVCEAHNDTVANNGWRSDAGCPPGTYQLESPVQNDPSEPNDEDNDWEGEGIYFCLLTGISGHSGIGIHGGGSCSEHPLAAKQGWCPTMNCIRVQNEDLLRFVGVYMKHTPMEIRVVQPA